MAGSRLDRSVWENVLFEIKKVIVGQEHLLEVMLVALLAKGHILIEGVPGLAKTLAIKTMAQVISGKFQRIQFTPDLVPADLVGTRIYNQQTGEFGTQFGPVFTNLLLADEINRAPAKVQSALLEVMQEHQVTIGNETYRVPEPFLVLATQNPIESEGTYQLPEAQIDRFMFKTVIGYPSPSEEATIVARVTDANPPVARPIVTTADLIEAQRQVELVYVDPKVIEYAVMLTTATRRPADFGLPQLAKFIAFGASPRGSINLILGAKALAVLRGRDYVVPDDVRDLALDVLRHRMVLSYEALAQEVTGDNIVRAILTAVRPPKLDLTGRPVSVS
ncbi:MAG: MoxR family ATPase [Chloroflexota bacterium]|nr:MoxR family ATPase [Dehalococcoidia bacterium]MDW8254563.1 MoxR family ATPase [Chloroflexota bacterium]